MQRVKSRLNLKFELLSLKQKEQKNFHPYQSFVFDEEECIKGRTKIRINFIDCFKLLDTFLEIIFAIMISLNLFILSMESFFEERIFLYEELSVKILNVLFFLIELFRKRWEISTLKTNSSELNGQKNNERALKLMKNFFFNILPFFSLIIAFFFERQFFLRLALYCFQFRKLISLFEGNINKIFSFFNLSALIEEYLFLIVKMLIFLHLWICFVYFFFKNDYCNEDALSLLCKYSFSLYQCLSFEEYKIVEINFDLEYLLKICIFKIIKLIFFFVALTEFIKISLNFSKEKMKRKYVNLF